MLNTPYATQAIQQTTFITLIQYVTWLPHVSSLKAGQWCHSVHSGVPTATTYPTYQEEGAIR